MVDNAPLYLGTVTTFIRAVCLLGCLMLCRCSFFFNTLAPLPDVAAFGKTSMQAELCTEQCSAGVLPDDSQSVEMDWLETQSVCRTSLRFGRRPLMASLSLFLLLFLPRPLSFLRSSMKQMNAQERQRHRGNQLDLFSCRNYFIYFKFSFWNLCLDLDTLWVVHE